MASRRSIVFTGLGLSLAACPRYAPVDEATTGVGGASDAVASSSGDSDASSIASIVVSSTATGAGGAGGTGGAGDSGGGGSVSGGGGAPMVDPVCLACADAKCPSASKCVKDSDCFDMLSCALKNCPPSKPLDFVCAITCFSGGSFQALSTALASGKCLREKCLTECTDLQ
jgi:hypothetical protein